MKKIEVTTIPRKCPDLTMVLTSDFILISGTCFIKDKILNIYLRENRESFWKEKLNKKTSEKLRIEKLRICLLFTFNPLMPGGNKKVTHT